MRLLLMSLSCLALAACANQPACGDAPGAKAVYFRHSCKPRIDQIIIGSDLNIPTNIKDDALANFNLDWSDPSVKNGQVDLGHYDLVPKGQVR